MLRAERNINLLFISRDRFPPTRPDVEVLFGQELSRRGFTIDWLLAPAAPEASARQISWQGGTVWLCRQRKAEGLLGKLQNRMREWRNEVRAYRLVKSGHYEILQIKDKFLACVIPFLLKKVGVDFIFTFWLSYPYHEEDRQQARTAAKPRACLFRLRAVFIEAVLRRIVFPHADHIFAQSDVMREDLIRLGALPDRVSAVPMGVDLTRLPPPGIAPLRPEVVYLGTLSRLRRLEFLIGVMRRVLDIRNDARLVLIGKGEAPGDEQLLKDAAAQLGIESQIDFRGHLPQRSAWQCLEQATVCVSLTAPTPLFCCSSPTKLVEYLALGKATVANDIPEQRHIIEQSGAGFCVPWDEEAVASAILTLLNDPALSQAMGEKGRLFIRENRSYHDIAETVCARYLQLVHAS